jgi:preprotein translocase subunit SecD
MIESMRVRAFLFVCFMAFSILYLLPSVVNLPEGWWFAKKKLSYGLDIQGGAHLTYGVDVNGVLSERIDRMARTLTQELKDKGVTEANIGPSANHDAVILKLKNEPDKAKALAHLRDQHGTVLQVVKESGDEIEARYFDAVLEEYRTQVINQAIEVIRNRVDEFGVAEPVIAAQGRDRILVQLPGISDPARAKELINKTAKLDFRLVDNNMDQKKLNDMVTEAEKTGGIVLGKDGLTYAQYIKKINEALKSKLPADTMVAFEKAPQALTMEAGKIAMLLRTDVGVSGDLLEDAFVRQGEFGEPKVAFRFGTEGARQFGELTSKNVQRLLAIVLDNVIFSAPVIKERIGGEGEISLGGSRNAEDAMKEGQLIATALRAGALPAALTQYEERSVGPSLGMDSIQKGKRAGLIGMILVVVFVIFYYQYFGVVAALCLGLNVMSLLALLSALGATLTLPGIAGITLTMGMAIDANVIIYERIREELARGSSVKIAIKEGFHHAWTAIFDSNVTNAIAAAVLVYFGSGPVRGFGVTLIAGIVTTMVTAVFVSRFLLDIMVKYVNVKKVSI